MSPIDIPGLVTWISTDKTGAVHDMLPGHRTVIIYQSHENPEAGTILQWDHVLTLEEHQKVCAILAEGTIMFDSSTRPDQSPE